MSFSESLEKSPFIIVPELDPPKGADPSKFLDSALAIKGRVEAVAITDCAHAVMRMGPQAPSKLLLDRNVDPIMIINGRDRNRLSLQADLLSAHCLGIRNVLLRMGRDPAAGDQPMVRMSGDLDLEVMLRCAQALNAGRDLGGEELTGATNFVFGAALEVSDDPNVNKTRAEGLAAMAAHGVKFVVLDPTYDVNLVDVFVPYAEKAGIKLFVSIMLLKSVAMIRYLNNMAGSPPIPHEFLKQMMTTPMKHQGGMEIAAKFIRDVKDRVSGAVLLALGWGDKLPEFLEMLDR